jgi:hypothetical protein
MANHKKPTSEELEENIKKSQEELEELDKKETPTETVLPSPSPEAPTEPSTPPPPAPTPTPEIPSPSEPPPSKEIFKDALRESKKKFSESSRESQVLLMGKKQLEDQIDEAQSMPEPTEEELTEEFPEWEALSDFEKRIAKDSFHNKRINDRIREIRNQQKEAEKKVNERIEEIDSFMAKPEVLEKFPQLQGKEEEFRRFSTKTTRLLVDLEDLTKLFLMEMPQPTKNKGKMFETGSGGPNERPQPKSDKISIDEARRLMQTDYKKYKEYLLAGKIDMSAI